MHFPATALERGMQIRDVLVRAMNKEYSWLRAAEILGITPRGLRRYSAFNARHFFQTVRREHGSSCRTPA